MTEQSTINKILALLAKAESSEFEAESATYLAKAQELMIKHAVEESQLRPEERETIGSETVTVSRARPDKTLMTVAALSVGVQFIQYSNSDRGLLFGTPSDITFVKALYASLVLQRERFLSREHKPYYENGRSFNHSFRVGFAGRVHARFKESKRVAVETSGPGTDLVLVTKDKQVEKAVHDQIGKTRTTAAVRASSHAGHSAGKAAANRADISGGRNNVGGTARRAVAS